MVLGLGALLGLLPASPPAAQAEDVRPPLGEQLLGRGARPGGHGAGLGALGAPVGQHRGTGRPAGGQGSWHGSGGLCSAGALPFSRPVRIYGGISIRCKKNSTAAANECPLPPRSFCSGLVGAPRVLPGDRGVLLLLQLQLVRWQQMVMWYCRLRVCYVVF